MRNRVIGFLFLVIITGCNEDKQTNALSIKKASEEVFNLNNYQAKQQKKVNDSVIHYEGVNNRFLIKGKYNYQRKYKIGWWRAYDLKNNEKYLDIEFYKEFDKKKELNNQIIFYRNNKINASNSKFYVKKYNSKDNTILYNFYFPKSIDKIHSAKINIGIIADMKPLLYPMTFECNSKNNSYSYSLDISKYKNHPVLNILGSFSEHSINEKKREIGINEILIDDTIKNVNTIR
ncbi:hypothetical protein LF887_04290 [Chryseobacterium sp. MEBOG06]|uniref:hypothetical protein n=1 Tax=Chryseobacterium sp. MEBOG06 TaxID=2879938 RepID=UPI001F28004D|nr:hypothetical protein [Chryseobacterium sp. MEBOG06]UKB84860.1 hypothetical protein LF887_04290 [Chryseobacterium sp. MEBOG06]